MADLLLILNAISTAKNAVKTATDIVKQFQSGGVMLTSTSEAEIEAAIKELEDMLPELRQSTQEKLRGTDG